jgi:hypothetical protein
MFRLIWVLVTTLMVVGSAALAQDAAAVQRVERISKAMEEAGAGEIAHSNDPADRVKISGVIRTEDDQPLEKPAHISVSVQAINHGTGTSLPPARDKFSGELTPGRIWLTVNAEGYAPKHVGPLRGEAGSVIDDVEVVLERGFAGFIQLVDEQNAPIAGAQVSGYPDFGMGGSHGKWTSDEDGIVEIPHAAAVPYSLNVKASGYEEQRQRKIDLDPNEPVLWVLREAVPARLRLTLHDVEPLAGATVRLMAVAGGASPQVHGWHGPELGATSEQGEIALESLEREASYVLLLETTDKQQYMLEDVRAGQEETVKLPEPLRIRGTIRGDLTQLAQHQGRPSISYWMTYRQGNSSHGGSSQWVPVEIDGDEARFEISGLLPLEVDISAGKQRTRLRLAQSIDDLVIKLPEQGSPEAADGSQLRPVIVRFDVPPGEPPVKGKVNLQSYVAGAKHISKNVDIENGEGHFDAYAGGNLSWRPAQVISHWYPEGNEQNVPAGEDEHVVTVQAWPAGAVTGTVNDEQGRPLDRISISIFTIERPPGIPQDTPMTLHNNRTMGGKFVVGVPLDGKYVVVAHREKTYVLSEEIEPTEDEPMPRVELTLPRGVDLVAQVVDDADQPLPGVPYSPSLKLPVTTWGFGTDQQTDSAGLAVVSAVNPEAGEWSLQIKPTRDYQAVTVPLAVGDEPAVVQLEKGQVLEGRVMDEATGWPVPGIELRARPAQHAQDQPREYLPEGPTDFEGRFRFSTLGGGPYRLFTHHRGANLSSSSQQQTVSAGDEGLEMIVTIDESSGLRPVEPKE